MSDVLRLANMIHCLFTHYTSNVLLMIVDASLPLFLCRKGRDQRMGQSAPFHSLILSCFDARTYARTLLFPNAFDF